MQNLYLISSILTFYLRIYQNSLNSLLGTAVVKNAFILGGVGTVEKKTSS